MMEQIIAFNLGRYLPDSTKEEIRNILRQVSDNILDCDLDTITQDQLAEILKEVYQFKIIEGGKDSYFVLQFKTLESSFMLKISRWNLKQLCYHLLSVLEFDNKITDSFDIPEQGQLRIEVVNVFGFLEVKSKPPVILVLQEFSSTIDYVEFTRQLANAGQGLPVNLLKVAVRKLRDNGFIIDYMPKNFHIRYNKERSIFVLEYLDYIHSNDPGIKQQAKEIAEAIKQDQLDPKFFETL